MGSAMLAQKLLIAAFLFSSIGAVTLCRASEDADDTAPISSIAKPLAIFNLPEEPEFWEASDEPFLSEDDKVGVFDEERSQNGSFIGRILNEQSEKSSRKKTSKSKKKRISKSKKKRNSKSKRKKTTPKKQTGKPTRKTPVKRSPHSPPSSRGIMNRIDACWRNDPNWTKNRMHLADCAIGFGYNSMGGKRGRIYVVTDSGDDPANPKPGTLRYGVTRLEPLWIIFQRDMVITLKNELIMTSYKTLDGRGVYVQIAYGPCITIQYVSHIIVHGLSIHDCKPGSAGRVMSSTAHVGDRQGSDGDAISIFGSSNIWIDHNYLAHCYDGLIDIIHASTAITVSNNYFTDHDKVMLLGHLDSYTADKVMKVTLVYNHFGTGLVQRMPRCRQGYFHIANNLYTAWEMYAIGGSGNPTIRSEGNYFVAPNNPAAKQVTKVEGSNRSAAAKWNWRSINDVFINGAYFPQTGSGTCAPYYTSGAAFPVAKGDVVPYLTINAGPLSCKARC